MKNLIEINAIETNQNFTHPYDEIEKEINFIGLEAERIKPKKAVLKHLFFLLDKTREKLYLYHDLKQGLIYYLTGDYYLKNGEYQFAKFSLEIAYELLKNYRGMNAGIKETLKNL
ncbi:MAG TPA: hypothetical protein DHW82_10110 [Spirochaetia bacterium]|nr:MAG: hypothetical protein A2Y41_14205 [Spirochaetes bacterium GWB1_36_13]HCL57344.1 hypothetical protein [Spirochaetia bacterium]